MTKLCFARQSYGNFRSAISDMIDCGPPRRSRLIKAVSPLRSATALQNPVALPVDDELDVFRQAGGDALDDVALEELGHGEAVLGAKHEIVAAQGGHEVENRGRGIAAHGEHG